MLDIKPFEIWEEFPEVDDGEDVSYMITVKEVCSLLTEIKDLRTRLAESESQRKSLHIATSIMCEGIRSIGAQSDYHKWLSTQLEISGGLIDG